ncbi:MAG: hypothetical protein NVSMB22_00540 [Chloroflexota bacterium]
MCPRRFKRNHPAARLRRWRADGGSAADTAHSGGDVNDNRITGEQMLRDRTSEIIGKYFHCGVPRRGIPQIIRARCTARD